MPVLDPSEYDASYFDGRSQPIRHNAGYGKYTRWYRDQDGDSLGEMFLDQAKSLIDQYQFSGTLLDIGCAKGFLVEDLRSFGVDAWGVDVSQYAYDEASEEVKPYLAIADIRTHINSYQNKEWDVIFSSRFLVCIDESELPGLINSMNKKSHQQIHIIDESPNSNFYVSHPLSWWASLGFARGTRLISQETGEVVVV